MLIRSMIRSTCFTADAALPGIDTRFEGTAFSDALSALLGVGAPGSVASSAIVMQWGRNTKEGRKERCAGDAGLVSFSARIWFSRACQLSRGPSAQDGKSATSANEPSRSSKF